MGRRRQRRRPSVDRERMGRVLSREIDAPWHVARDLWGADALEVRGRPHSGCRFREAARDLTRSKTLCTYGRTAHGNREIPRPAASQDAARIGKSGWSRATGCAGAAGAGSVDAGAAGCANPVTGMDVATRAKRSAQKRAHMIDPLGTASQIKPTSRRHRDCVKLAGTPPRFCSGHAVAHDFHQVFIKTRCRAPVCMAVRRTAGQRRSEMRKLRAMHSIGTRACVDLDHVRRGLATRVLDACAAMPQPRGDRRARVASRAAS